MPDRRETEAFLRVPAGLNTFAYGTVDGRIAGLQHYGRMAVHPEPSDGDDDEFGITTAGGFTVELADEGDDDWLVLDANGEPINDTNLDYIVEAY